jgi:hypothetical protein
MKEQDIIKFHILNYFKAKGAFAATSEMMDDLKMKGYNVGGTEFGQLLDADCFDCDRFNSARKYKLNAIGNATLERLQREKENDDNIADLARRQLQDAPLALKSQRRNTMWVIICAILTAGALVEAYLLSKCK